MSSSSKMRIIAIAGAVLVGFYFYSKSASGEPSIPKVNGVVPNIESTRDYNAYAEPKMDKPASQPKFPIVPTTSKPKFTIQPVRSPGIAPDAFESGLIVITSAGQGIFGY